MYMIFIVPLFLTASDEELFEDKPEEYIRRDIEGSDVDTRRRAACDLVKVLSRYFEEKMMQIFGQYVQVWIQLKITGLCVYCFPSVASNILNKF